MTASTAYAWLTSPTTTWVTPMITPPTRVPHSDPMPPITTASNAKISMFVPVSGSNVLMVPMKTPARAAVAIAMPATVANTGRTLMPTSLAVSTSSDVARTLRPHDVRDSRSCRPDRTTHAVRNAARKSQDTVMLPMWKLASASAPPFSPRGSDVAATCSRFSIMTDSPNVTSTGASTPCRRARPNSSTSRAMPTAKATGSSSGSVYHTGTPSAEDSTSPR